MVAVAAAAAGGSSKRNHITAQKLVVVVAVGAQLRRLVRSTFFHGGSAPEVVATSLTPRAQVGAAAMHGSCRSWEREVEQPYRLFRGFPHILDPNFRHPRTHLFVAPLALFCSPLAKVKS